MKKIIHKVTFMYLYYKFKINVICIMNVNLFLLFGLVSTKDLTSNLRYNYALPHWCNIQVHIQKGIIIIIIITTIFVP